MKGLIYGALQLLCYNKTFSLETNQILAVTKVLTEKPRVECAGPHLCEVGGVRSQTIEAVTL